MSGRFGWTGNSRADDSVPLKKNYSKNYSSDDEDVATPSKSHTYNSQAYRGRAYTPKSQALQIVSPAANGVDLNPKRLKSNAKNVLVVCMDVTGSLSEWTGELFQRLPLLYTEAQKYLGSDLEVLFLAFGDVAYGDPIQVTQFGRGQILDTYLDSLSKTAIGGGNGVESPDIVAVYLADNVDTSSATNVYTYFVTDEGIPQTVDSSWCERALPGLYKYGKAIPQVCGKNEMLMTKKVFECLSGRGAVFAIVANTNAYGPQGYQRTRQSWHTVLGQERVLLLDDARRLVDVMLGVMAKLTHQYVQYTQDLASRQKGTQYGDENMRNVHQTLMLVGNSPDSKLHTPTTGTKSLI